MRLPAPHQNEYVYIIAGAGLAGLSLAYYLSKSTLGNVSVLIIDEFQKNTNDKTWCYWSDEKEEFDVIAEKEWSRISVFPKIAPSDLFDITPYKYKKIKSEDWYNYIKSELLKKSNFHFLQAKIQQINYAGIGVNVETSKGNYLAKKKVFDSISPFPIDLDNPLHIKQHFLGWNIESNFPAFKADSAHLFDFRVASGRDCEFMYVLPVNSHTALFEHTFFSGTLKDKEYYKDKIRAYLAAYYDLSEEDYQIKEEEYGIIPMMELTNKPQYLFQKWIKIGTAGGFVKSTSGYSFLRTQKICKRLVQNLENENFEAPLIKKSLFKSWIDRIFLKVLAESEIHGNEIFEALFKNNSPVLILKFLEEDTHWLEDLKIMSSVPTSPFFKAVIADFTQKKSRN
ncbi:lycopene cyclase family protein [Aquirufa sp. ROCK-SH2]